MGNMSSPVERRSVIKAAAWAAPVIAVSAVAPMAAASDGPAPLPTRFYYTVGTDSTTINGVTTNLSVVGGNVSLEGKPGDSAGVATIAITLPEGYTWQETQTNYAWTGPVSSTTSAGKTRITYTSAAPLTIADGQNSASIYFTGGKLVGTGASPSNPAALRIATTQYPGTTSNWPSDED